MSKHTPGPWVVYGNGIFPKGKSSNIATASIMNFELNHDGTQKPCKEMEANANLIAAAPDLLAALNRLVDLHLCEQEGVGAGMPTAEDWYEAVEAAEAAIEKAEGGEQ